MGIRRFVLVHVQSPNYFFNGLLTGQGETRALLSDDTACTATIERLPDSAPRDLEKVWDAEWEKHSLTTATESVKRQVKAEHFQLFDLYVLQHLPVRDVARTLGVSVGQVYLTKHRVARLLKKELARLQEAAR